MANQSTFRLPWGKIAVLAEPRRVPSVTTITEISVSSGSDDVWRVPESPDSTVGPAGPPVQPAPPAQPRAGAPYAQYPQYGVQPMAVEPLTARAPTRLGTAAQVLLGVVILVQLIGELPVLLRQRSLLRQIAIDPGSVGLGQATRSDDDVSRTAVLYSVVFLATAIVFAAWFYQARRNADAYGSAVQRHSRGWAIGGWFCPVVNLWFPFQIAVDIARASEQPGPAQADRPGWSDQPSAESTYGPPATSGLGLLRAWWAMYLLNVFVSEFVRLGLSGSSGDLVRSADLELIAIVPSVLAAALAIMMVRRITAAQRRRELPGLVA